MKSYFLMAALICVSGYPIKGSSTTLDFQKMNDVFKTYIEVANETKSFSHKIPNSLSMIIQSI